ncbi:MAG: hypothetical protein HY551_04595 [Elusimicrobia bacterium]|nr:hypothetical protein [Elusimicrobiota bacterium]
MPAPPGGIDAPSTGTEGKGGPALPAAPDGKYASGTAGKDALPLSAPPGALPHVSSYKPPLEISLSPPKPSPSSVPGVERPVVSPKVPVPPAKAPAPMPPSAVKAPAPIISPISSPAPASKPPASPSAPAFTEIPAAGLGEPIADNVPKEQIRSLAFFYSVACRDKFPSFIQFIDSVALHLTKKPLYLRKVLVLEIPVDVEMARVVERIGKSRVAAAVGFLSDINVREMEEAFSEAGIFFRSVRPEDIGKRSTALDLLVDVTLLAPG